MINIIIYIINIKVLFPLYTGILLAIWGVFLPGAALIFANDASTRRRAAAPKGKSPQGALLLPADFGLFYCLVTLVFEVEA